MRNANLVAIFISIVLITTNVYAEKNVEYGIFGVEVGVPYTVKPAVDMKDSGTPFWEFRAPVPEDYPLKQFHDFSISVNPQNRNVAGLRAERAYSHMEDCMKERNSILRYLTSQYGEPVDLPKGRFLSQGGETVEVSCILSAMSPFHTLSLQVHSRKEWDLIKERMRNGSYR